MLTVEQATRALEEHRGDALAVVTMSPLAYWHPRDDDYGLMGLMGGAGSIGLGLAVGLPERRVLVVDGDGSLLMQLGVLSAVGGTAPANLAYAVIDNSMYAISGGQPMPVATDWPALMTAVGFRRAVSCESADDVRAALADTDGGPIGLVIRCEAARPAYPPGSFAVDPAEEAHRLRRVLAGPVQGTTTSSVSAGSAGWRST